VDKTGTITQGKPTVEKVGAFAGDFTKKQVLDYIVSLNSNSEHPLADATVNYGKEHDAEIIKSSNFSAVTGKGVEAEIDNKNVALGNSKMMEFANSAIASEMKEEVQTYQKQGKSVSYLAVDK